MLRFSILLVVRTFDDALHEYYLILGVWGRLAVSAVPDFDVTFAYLNFRLKGFPVSDFQHGDGYTESQRLM